MEKARSTFAGRLRGELCACFAAPGAKSKCAPQTRAAPARLCAVSRRRDQNAARTASITPRRPKRVDLFLTVIMEPMSS